MEINKKCALKYAKPIKTIGIIIKNTICMDDHEHMCVCEHGQSKAISFVYLKPKEEEENGRLRIKQ